MVSSSPSTQLLQLNQKNQIQIRLDTTGIQNGLFMIVAIVMSEGSDSCKSHFITISNMTTMKYHHLVLTHAIITGNILQVLLIFTSIVLTKNNTVLL